MPEIAGGILLAYVAILIGGVIAGGICLLVKLVWIFFSSNDDLRRAKLYRKRDAQRSLQAKG